MFGTCWGKAAWAAMLCLGAGVARAGDAPVNRTANKPDCPCRAVTARLKLCVQSPGMAACWKSVTEWLPVSCCGAVKCVRSCAATCPKCQATGCCLSAAVQQCTPANTAVPTTAAMPEPLPMQAPYAYVKNVDPGTVMTWPAPMPYPCSVPSMRAPRGKEYVLELKVVEARPGQQDKTTPCPRMVLREGQCASINYTDRLLLDECRPACTACASSRHKASGSAVHPCAGSCAAAVPTVGVLDAAMCSRPEGKVGLELAMEEARCKTCGKQCVELGKHLHVSLEVTTGEPTRIVLDRTAEGKPRRWLEARVTTAPSEHQPSSSPVVQEQIAALWDAVTDLTEMAEHLIAERVATVSQSPALPPPYLQHPPQYLPPPPPLPEPLPHPAVGYYTASIPEAAPYCTTVCTTPNAAPAARDTSWLEIGAAEDNACCAMTLNLDGKCGPLHVAVSESKVHLDGPSLKAVADRLRVKPDGCVVLEGHVKVEWEKDGQHAKVGGGRVVVHPADGRLEVEAGPK